MADNRTEQATPKRRNEARDKGQVLRSRDLVSALTVLGVVVILAWHPEGWVGRWQSYFARALDASVRNDWSAQAPVIQWTGLAVAQWLWPLFAAAWLIATGATLSQGGLVVATEALAPNWERLNPANNLKQLFSLAGFSRVLRSLLPSGVIFYLALRLIRNDASTILHAARLSSRASLALIGGVWFRG